jgi:hypothetical protein
MPFPKDVPYGEAIRKELEGYPVDDFEGVELVLTKVEHKLTEQYGERYVLICQKEDGTTVKLATFSEVIADQIKLLGDRLPVIIKPRKEANYFTIL